MPYSPRVCDLWVSTLVLLTLCVSSFGQVQLSSDAWTVTIDPGTLAVHAQPAQGDRITLSSPQPNLGTAQINPTQDNTTEWSLPDHGLTVRSELNEHRLTMHFASDRPGKITWPILPGQKQVKAFILPMFEGVYAPTEDEEWMAHLADYGPMDTTADLSMPFVGLDLNGQTLTYIFANIFDNKLRFQQDEQGVAIRATHDFQSNWGTWEYTVIIELGDASPIEPARRYRAYLIERDEFVTMTEKIQANPQVHRLLGASHAYLWDAGLFSHLDAADWKGFCAKLHGEGAAETDSLGKQLWDSFNDEAREAVTQIIQEQWPSKYSKSVVASQVSAFLEAQIKTVENNDGPAETLNTFCQHFDGLIHDPETWGDGISTKLLDKLHDAGLKRMLLCLGDLNSADLKPQTARKANELGYLFGPYDSYHSIHSPDAHPEKTWVTAQFNRELYESGPIVKEDGTKSAGFKKVGYHLSPLAARPHIEDRVNRYMARVPFTAVFVDCDAFGQFFDDYAPEHTATKQQDMLERLDRLRWLSNQHSLVVGSEGGSAYAVPAIHFAHGMFTPVIGWGDKDLKDRESPYYLGAYYPPTGPAVFIKQVPLKPKFEKFYYDPHFRLPLYQIVFHDSVIATHHWGNASLKYEDKVDTVALLEQLYNVPPLYHLNHAEFKKHKQHILKHDAFFSPLHKQLALQPMTDFRWLSADRSVQETIFGDGTWIAVNFSETHASIHGHDLPPGSAIAVRSGLEPVYYTPGAPDTPNEPK